MISPETDLKDWAATRWTPPPNWPDVPRGWVPPPDWRPDPTWGPPFPGWAFIRLGDCAADATLPLAYRDEELDEKFRTHIGAGGAPAISFLSFLSNVVDIVQSSFKVSGEAGRAGAEYRAAALRSVQAATEIIEEAARRDIDAPFVFFACVQDALSAEKMFAAAADLSVDDGRKADNLAAFAEIARERPLTADGADPAGQDPALEREAYAKFQVLFDYTVATVMGVMQEALRQSKQGGSRSRLAQLALEEMDEVNRLIGLMSGGRVGMRQGLQVVEDLERVGRKVATLIDVPYDSLTT